MKFGIRSAVDVVFKTTRDYTGSPSDFLLTEGYKWRKGEPVLYFDSLKMATTEGEAETVYARGGDGNNRLIAWEGDKEVTFTFEDALISAEGMSILTGADLITGEVDGKNKVRVNKKAVIPAETGSGAATAFNISLADHLLDHETLVEDRLTIFGFIVGPDGEILERLQNPETVADKVVTFDNEKIEEGSTILVDFYAERVDKFQQVNITPDKFAGYFYIEGDTLFRRRTGGRDLAAQIAIPNAKIQTAFEFSMSPEGDPSTFTFTADAFPGVLAGEDARHGEKLYAIRILED